MWRVTGTGATPSVSTLHTALLPRPDSLAETSQRNHLDLSQTRLPPKVRLVSIGSESESGSLVFTWAGQQRGDVTIIGNSTPCISVVPPPLHSPVKSPNLSYFFHALTHRYLAAKLTFLYPELALNSKIIMIRSTRKWQMDQVYKHTSVKCFCWRLVCCSFKLYTGFFITPPGYLYCVWFCCISVVHHLGLWFALHVNMMITQKILGIWGRMR